MQTAKISLAAVALSLLLSAPASATLDTSCMVTAVEKRDNAIITAWDTYSATAKSALTTRRDALKTAWADSNRSTRRASIKNAWRSFRASIKSARRTFKSSRNSAWRTFNSERNTCGASASDESFGSGDESTL